MAELDRSKRLAFGSAISTWEHVRRLYEMDVTHVINLSSSRRYRMKLRSFHSLWLPFPDDKKDRPVWFYRRALRFYKDAMRKGNSKVFVMCHHGICRSASLTSTPGVTGHSQSGPKRRAPR